jgi:hypothetical protein
VTTNSDNAGLADRKVLRLGTQLPVGAGEEKVLGNEPVERVDISRELCPSPVGFEGYDFWVAEPDQDSFENGCVCVDARHFDKLSGCLLQTGVTRARHSGRGLCQWVAHEHAS